MHSRLFVFSVFLFYFHCSFSQDIKYAHEVLGQLCSPGFHGRGYVDKGDKIASAYIVRELKKWNINPVNNSFLQYFDISVNTFPSDISVEIDTSYLKPGEDYIVSANSGSCKGSFDLVWLSDDNLNSLSAVDLSRSFLVIDTSMLVKKNKEILANIYLIKKTNNVHAKGIIEIIDRNRIIQTMSQVANDYPLIVIKKNKITKNSKKICIRLKNKFLKKYKTQNVMGELAGNSDSVIIFGAHYDHLGQMGKKTYFPGANDNASGVSMLLNLAEYYSSLKTKQKYTILFIFFSAEEVGLLGSEYFTGHPPFDLSKIKLMLNLDMVGSGDKGITVVNGSIFTKDFHILDSLNNANHYIVKINSRGEAKNSDHYNFYHHGVKSLFIYTMGEYSEYHNIFDKAESLDLNSFENLFKLITNYISLQ